ncbi:unknown [Roseburia sp. CAG:182]|nr:unknown [Roseburia sp. CAG:182]
MQHIVMSLRWKCLCNDAKIEEKSLKKEASIPALLFFHIFLYGINIISNMTFADGYVYLQLLIFFRQRPEKREEKRDRNSS